ncbi:hypothetical protein BCY90_16125 [Agrobacterium deltaense]|uniref:mandelate racemase/muconate lactonizing enzyme family protein n=1 Tax=Agrobacterium TaxID=357 RepID=UPI000745A7A5|nr:MULTISPECIES: mandelate racemase/muconate lactonizing enzyme family protein [Agrobacterium]KVK54226.1 hypothetical protein L901_17815 [Agrobacterium sp. D14]RKF41830.1 hypothetical protein BCY90_16125 [Agrobacterium deltaense]
MARIVDLKTIFTEIPFDDGGRGEGITPSRWHSFHNVLVRLEDEDGLVGWGEAFAYFCAPAVVAAVEKMVAPLVVGKDIDDIPAWNQATQRALHIFGRYGITIFALSGVDIALWDLKAKRAGKRLAELVSQRARTDVEAYSSLVAYRDPVLVGRYAGQSVEEGFKHVKLHEIAADAIAAARPAMGDGIGLMVDVNCNWTIESTLKILPQLIADNTMWLEEPIFPPEDYKVMAQIEKQGIAIGAGENACTAFPFNELTSSITYPQPSLTKVGGVSVFLEIAAIAARAGKALMPHSPYFGPGYFATLNLFAALDERSLFEFLYVKPHALLGVETPLPINGRIALPAGKGIGFEPDEDVLRAFAAK